jgi:transcriptional regulator with XRE-family HTH domain
MAHPNIFLSANLKFLRNRKKISQEDFASALEISRSKVAHYEGGKSVNPPIEDLLRFSDYFKISVDSLLRVNLSKLTELKLRDLEAGNDVYVSGGNIRVLAISVNGKNKENTEYVPIAAKAGYLKGYNDPEFIGKLPKFSLPHLSEKRTYRMFPTKGDSMLPIPEKSLIVTEYVDDWKVLDNVPCIVIMNADQDFLFKMVSYLPINNSLLLHSLNSEYKDTEVFAGDVVEIWKYHSHLTDKIPSSDNLIQEILNCVNEIKVDVKKLN